MPTAVRRWVRAILVDTVLAAVTLILAFSVGELVVRFLYKDHTVLYPRYHTDYHYGRYHLRGNRPHEQFWHTSIDGSWKFVTNGKGFRDSREFAHRKPAGVTRILAIGDSHTQGHEVRQEATYSAVLERYLGQHGVRAESLNSGVSGFGTAEELAFLENEGVKYQPDVVMLGFFANDFDDNNKSGLFAVRDGKLIETRHEHVPGVRLQNFIYRIPGVQWLGENSYLYSLTFNAVWHYFKVRLTEQARERRAPATASTRDAEQESEFAVPTKNWGTPQQIELAYRLIARMQEFCRQRHIELLVADIPALGRDSRHFRSSIPPALREKLHAIDVDVIDSTALLGEFNGVVPIHVPHGYHHISEFTHALLGAEAGRRVVEKLGLPKT